MHAGGAPRCHLHSRRLASTEDLLPWGLQPGHLPPEPGPWVFNQPLGEWWLHLQGILLRWNCVFLKYLCFLTGRNPKARSSASWDDPNQEPWNHSERRQDVNLVWPPGLLSCFSSQFHP